MKKYCKKKRLNGCILYSAFIQSSHAHTTDRVRCLVQGGGDGPTNPVISGRLASPPEPQPPRVGYNFIKTFQKQ